MSFGYNIRKCMFVPVTNLFAVLLMETFLPSLLPHKIKRPFWLRGEEGMNKFDLEVLKKPCVPI